MVEVTVDHDECNRPDTTLEGLAALKPVHAGGQQIAQGKYITAGNASQFADGAVGLRADERGDGGEKEPEADGHLQGLCGGRRRAGRNGHRPDQGGAAPAERHGLKVDDIDLWELNEAFASQTALLHGRAGA